MSHTISRRNVAKGAAWTAPALAIASAAPATAASCTPTTVNAQARATWVSTQTGFSTLNDGDPEVHTVQYTVTNNGPDAIPAGLEMNIKVTIVVLQGEESKVEVTQASNSVSTTVSNDVTNDDDAGTTTDVATIRIVTTSAIASGDSFVVTVVATYGAVSTSGDSEATEEVHVESPQTLTDPTTCVTTVATVTITGHSDGTSYTS